MRKETESKKNRAIGIAPSVPWRLHNVCPLEHYRLQVWFLDGVEGFVDLSNLIMSENAGVFKVLRDKDLFNQVFLDHGVVTWPGEVDLAPDAMYNIIKKQGEWVIR